MHTPHTYMYHDSPTDSLGKWLGGVSASEDSLDQSISSANGVFLQRTRGYFVTAQECACHRCRGYATKDGVLYLALLV